MGLLVTGNNGDERLLKLPCQESQIEEENTKVGDICSRVRYIQNIRYIAACGTYAEAFRPRGGGGQYIE